MYQFLNVHPEGKFVPDCVKRAITKAAEMDYHEVQLELNRHKRVTGAKTFNEGKNWKSYIENVLNGTKLSFPATKGIPRMNGERFCKAFPRGRYILNMAGHLSCCVDGIIYDSWDCSEKCVYTAYEIKPQVKHYYTVTKVRNEDKYIINVYEGSEVKTFEANRSEIKGMTKCLDLMHFERK
ncbi:MAG: hypothetical protein J6R47_04145 [Acholeplasmatales bacterium]|nr:hypothetical protein [Acholeplasmatales bacterium]